jgi:putative ABC transport system ATP-binding protein
VGLAEPTTIRQLSGSSSEWHRPHRWPPRLLFADEPTGNLDAATGEEIVDLMFDLNREHHTTLLLVTHDEKLATRCRRRLRLDAGRLVH